MLLPVLLLAGLAGDAQTKAGFSISRKTGCVPLSGVNFTDISTGGTVVRRDWDLGNGTIINNGSGTVGTNYLNDGRFYVRLTTTFSNGDVRSKLDSVIVYPLPVAGFSADDVAGCLPHTVNFTSQASTATGTVTNWLWDFGAGGSNQSNPSFTYTVNGDYNVSLIVKNNWGCQSEAVIKLHEIQVYPKVNASFNIPVNYSCSTPFTVNFVNTSTGGGIITYVWDFGDGQTSTSANPLHTYVNPGVYTVTLTARNGVNCVSSYSTAYYNSVYAGKPVPSIQAPAAVCANTAVNLTGAVSPASFLYTVQWIFPDNGAVQYGQNTTHIFTTPGKYEIKMVAYNYAGCNDTAKQMITVRPGPHPDFSADKAIGCDTPFSVQFRDLTTPLNGLTKSWDFGDGSPVSLMTNPLHTYKNFGAYTVTLIAKDGVTGCTGIMQKPDTIRIVQPAVDFTYTPPEGCNPLPVKTTARLSNIVDPVVSYIWDFGDGARVATPGNQGAHTYNTAGNYNIRLKIVTQQGCMDSSILKPVSVAALCDGDGSGDGGGGGGGGGAGFTVGKSCTDKYTITFTDTVTNARDISWDFGDGSPLYTQIPLNPVVHTFPVTAKKYIVTLTREDMITHQISTAQLRAIIIDEKAKFSPDITDICKNKTVNFITAGIDSSHIRKYTWDFGDGVPRYTIDNKSYFDNYGIYLNGNTSHTYADTGVFYVKLIIEDKLGCIDSFQYAIPVRVKGPAAGFLAGPSNFCQKDFIVTFTDTSRQNGATPLVEWIWNFGDGSPALTTTQDTVMHHAYTNDNYYNFYTVSLSVKDAVGCQTQVTRNNCIKSYRPKSGFFSYDTLKCGSFNVFLYNYSSAYNASYLWYYGDGTGSSAYYGSHTYTADGKYDIKLVVTDENGCKDSLTAPSYVKLVKPAAGIRVGDTSQCAPVAINFYDSSVYANNYVWNFGDGGTGSTDKDPAAHIYAVPGYYPVKLHITGVSGCIDSITRVIRVKGPIGVLSPGPSMGCIPFTLPMHVTGSNISTYAWDYGDGTPVQQSTDAIIHHLYPLAGRFLPNVVLTSPEGCPFTLRAADSLIIDSARAKFVFDRPLRCVSDPAIAFVNQSSTAFGVDSYEWQFGDGQVSAEENPVHTFNAGGLYGVSLVVKSHYGCTDVWHSPQPVRIFNQPLVQIAGDWEKCAMALLAYRADIVSEDSITGYTWTINQAPVSLKDSFQYRFANAGLYDLAVRVNTKYGCEKSVGQAISIRPLPVPAASPRDTTICIERPVPMHAYDGDHFHWWPADWLQKGETADPVAYPLQGTRYYVKVINSFGCEQTDSVFVKVDKKVNLQHSPDVIICKGEHTRLSAAGLAIRFQWDPAVGLNDPSIADPVASPEQTILYRVIGFSGNTCPDDTGHIQVLVGNIPTVNLGADFTIDAGSLVTLNPTLSNDVTSYSWEPVTGLSCDDCASPQFIADKDISYQLKVSTQYNCEASSTIHITVACGKGAVYIPNAFTPDRNGRNDIFYIKGYGIQKVKAFHVYNRLGQLVFSREDFYPNDPNYGWDGRYRNIASPAGTYVYLAEVICNEGKPVVLKGTVILIR